MVDKPHGRGIFIDIFHIVCPVGRKGSLVIFKKSYWRDDYGEQSRDGKGLKAA